MGRRARQTTSLLALALTLTLTLTACGERAAPPLDGADVAATDAATVADAVADAQRDASADTGTDAAPWDRLDDAGVAPGARTTHVAAFDLARGEAVFFGGFDGTPLDELWAFRTAERRWRRVEPVAPGPLPRHLTAMIADPARDRMVVFLGWGLPGSLGDVWALELAGPRWVQLPSGPSARFDIAAATDGARAWLFGGYSAMEVAPTTVLDELWELDLASGRWTQRARVGPWPGPRTVSSFAYRDGALYLSGGHDWTQTFRDAWRFDLASGRWQSLAPDGSRAVWAHHGAALDAACGELLLAGGDNNDGPQVRFAARVALDPSAWMGDLPGLAPTPRRHVPMAFDPATRLLVLHGGDGSDGAFLADTWVYQVPPCAGH